MCERGRWIRIRKGIVFRGRSIGWRLVFRWRGRRKRWKEWIGGGVGIEIEVGVGAGRFVLAWFLEFVTEQH